MFLESGTVKDLKEQLNKLPDDTVVLLSMDEEGNACSQLMMMNKPFTLNDVNIRIYRIHGIKDSQKGQKAIVLYPSL